MQYFKAVNKMKIKERRAQEVINRFEKAKSIHTFNGFIFMEVIEKVNTDGFDEVEICTTWSDQASFDAWQHSASFVKAHKPIEERDKRGEDNPIIESGVDFYVVHIQHMPEDQEDDRAEKLHSMLMEASKPVLNRLDQLEENLLKSELPYDKLSSF